MKFPWPPVTAARTFAHINCLQINFMTLVMVPRKIFLEERQHTAMGNYNLKWQQQKFNVQGESEELYLLQLVNFQRKRIIFSLFD